MKKLLLGVLLPVLCLFAIIGTGFATWYFSDTTVENQEKKLGLNVESYAHVGTITLEAAETLTLNFDQPTDKVNGVDGITLVDAQKAPQNIVATYKGPEGKLSREVTFKVTVSLPAGVAEYVKLKGFTKVETNFTKEVTVAENAEGTSVSQQLQVQSTDFQYVSGKVPQNVADYEAMKAKLTGEILVTFEATIA